MEAVERHITLRINYMEKYTVCSTIDVDEEHRKVSVTNRVADYSKCAFGALENPPWDAFEWFLESRCFSREEADVGERLKELGLSDYDPMQIVERTKGRLPVDHHWMQIIHFT